MANNKSDGLTPGKLQFVLIATIVLIIAAGGAGFWFFHTQLSAYAKQVASDNAAASESTNDIAKLQDLEKELNDNKVAVTRAKNIVADSEYYQYQNQIINDINAYAKASGVQVTSYTFNTATPTGASASSTSTPATTTPVTPSGLQTITATVAIKSPVSYEAAMKFIHAIELNLTKMQLAGIALSQPDSETGVNMSPITIEVYTRKANS